MRVERIWQGLLVGALVLSPGCEDEKSDSDDSSENDDDGAKKKKEKGKKDKPKKPEYRVSPAKGASVTTTKFKLHGVAPSGKLKGGKERCEVKVDGDTDVVVCSADVYGPGGLAFMHARVSLVDAAAGDDKDKAKNAKELLAALKPGEEDSLKKMKILDEEDLEDGFLVGWTQVGAGALDGSPGRGIFELRVDRTIGGQKFSCRAFGTVGKLAKDRKKHEEPQGYSNALRFCRSLKKK